MVIRFKDIQLMNEAQIAYLKKMGRSTKNNEIVEKILEDEACFFKMEKEDALRVLSQIGVAHDKLDKIYENMISKQQYYDLDNRGKINKDDKELKIKYEDFNSRDMFNRSK